MITQKSISKLHESQSNAFYQEENVYGIIKFHKASVFWACTCCYHTTAFRWQFNRWQCVVQQENTLHTSTTSICLYPTVSVRYNTVRGTFHAYRPTSCYNKFSTTKLPALNEFLTWREPCCCLNLRQFFASNCYFLVKGNAEAACHRAKMRCDKHVCSFNTLFFNWPYIFSNQLIFYSSFPHK